MIFHFVLDFGVFTPHTFSRQRANSSLFVQARLLLGKIHAELEEITQATEAFILYTRVFVSFRQRVL